MLITSPKTAQKAEWYLENSRNREHHASRPLNPTQGSIKHMAPPHTAGTSSWTQEVALLPPVSLAKGKTPHPLLPTVQDSASPHPWHVLRRNTSKRATCPTLGAPRKHFWWQTPTGSDGSSGTPGCSHCFHPSSLPAGQSPFIPCLCLNQGQAAATHPRRHGGGQVTVPWARAVPSSRNTPLLSQTNQHNPWIAVA